MSDINSLAHAMRALEPNPRRVRRYAVEPAADAPDPAVEQFRRQRERDAQLRERLRHEAADQAAYERGEYEP